MKYESNILKRLIDTYGVIGNPRYLSEIIKEFIVRGKELYPQLFTYQSDWLAHIDEFGLTPDYVVSYTGQQIYTPHTKEKPVKRAILKGSTKYRDIDTGEVLDAFEDGRNLELVSVKMPVLTTTGKNLFDINNVIQQDGLVVNGNSILITENRDYPDNIIYTFENAPTESVLSFDLSSNNVQNPGAALGSIWYEDGTKIWITVERTRYKNTKKITDIKIHNWCRGTHIFSNIQLEQGSATTTYEPYKTNILTVNDDVTLRKVGNVQDTLDGLTGEVVERVGYADINSFVAPPSYRALSDNQGYMAVIGLENKKQSTDLVANLVKVGTINNTDFGMYNNPGNIVVFKKNCTLDEMKSLINQIQIIYELETESIKTVDLTIRDKDQQKVERLTSFEGGTHFTTSSQDGSLLPTLTVDVVTDLEETLSLCSMDGNTL